MRVKPSCWLLAAAVFVTHCLEASLVELADDEQWERLLLVANRRAEQLPLRPEESLLAATAARAVGDRESEVRHLRRAAEEGPLADVARLELAEALVGTDPVEALELAVPMLRAAPTRTMRKAAVEVTVRALGAGVDSPEAKQLERLARVLPTDLRRRLELALTVRDPIQNRPRLVRLLEGSTADLVGLGASRALQAMDELAPRERWLVAESLFQHALYDEALTVLAGLEGVLDRQVPAWEVAFVAGRCAFRRGRWDEAVARYRAAAERTRNAEHRADLAVHEARAHELAGRLEMAADCAARAVASRPTDDRRLLLARLRLRLGQTDRASVGVARTRGRRARARGELMIALAEIRDGRTDEARRRLARIGQRPWSGPAAVLGAGLAAEAGEPEEAMRLLDGAATALDGFWAERARATMERLPKGVVEWWRARCASEVDSWTAPASRRGLARWTTLEIDSNELQQLRERVAAVVGLAGELPTPDFPDGLADRLWQLGLRGSAARWDPGGLPTTTTTAALWTAQRLVELGVPSQGLRTADLAWRLAGPDLPVRAYPEGLRRALHPLPYPSETWRGAVASSVPWTLVAGVAREESRWEAGVVSAVGARGLMQLMPDTAAGVAALIERPAPTLDQLFDPRVSLELGSVELGRLYGLFGGNLPVVVAAYNAGESQARIWLDQCGESCVTERYVAGITFSATSRYTRDVLSAAVAYAELYGPRPPQVAASASWPSRAPRAVAVSAGGSESPRSARQPNPATARSRR